jgi:hypothetical protein
VVLASVKSIADRFVEAPPFHRAQCHRHRRWHRLSSKGDILVSAYRKLRNSFFISFPYGPLIIRWQASFRTLKLFLQSSQYYSDRMPSVMKAETALAMMPRDLQSLVNEGNPIVLVGQPESTPFDISTLFCLMPFSSDVECIGELHSTPLCCTSPRCP